jgi:hypothetical protein
MLLAPPRERRHKGSEGPPLIKAIRPDPPNEAPAQPGQKEDIAVPITKIRALVLTLLAVMLAGSVMAGAASAEPGPFWHHRPLNGSGEGAKIEPNAPENFEGNGGQQTLTSEVAAKPENLKVELKSPAVQVKGAIFNNAHQGQIKLVIFYQTIIATIGGKAAPNCKVMVGQQGQFSNIVQVKGHLAWKWNGTEKQLNEQPQNEQKPDIVFTAVEPQEQTGRPLTDLRQSGTFAEFKFVGTECSLLNATFPKVSGAEVGIPNPSQLEEWSRTLEVRTIGSGQLPAEVLGKKVEGMGFLQHIWVGAGYQPLITGLTFEKLPANLVGQTKTTAAQQEIAVFGS